MIDRTSRFWLCSGNVKNDDGKEETTERLSRLVEERIKILSDGGIRFAGQLERGGERGRLHMHILLRFPSPCRHTHVRKTLEETFPPDDTDISGWDHQIARDPKGAGIYVTKNDGTRVGGPWISEPPPVVGIHTTPSGSGGSNTRKIRTRDETAREIIDGVERGLDDGDMIRQNPKLLFHGSAIDRARLLFTPAPDPRRRFTVLYIYGPPGTGKTTYAPQLAGPSIFLAQSSSPFLQGYRGEDTIIFDDVTPARHEQWTEDFIRICEPTTRTHRVLYGVVTLRHSCVIMTSNFQPHEIFNRQAMQRRINFIFEMPTRNMICPLAWNQTNILQYDPIYTCIPLPEHPYAA